MEHTRVMLEADPDLRARLQVFDQYTDENRMTETWHKYVEESFLISSCLREFKSVKRRR